MEQIAALSLFIVDITFILPYTIDLLLSQRLPEWRNGSATDL